jgi:hypothetical protein
LQQARVEGERQPFYTPIHDKKRERSHGCNTRRRVERIRKTKNKRVLVKERESLVDGVDVDRLAGRCCPLVSSAVLAGC